MTSTAGSYYNGGSSERHGAIFQLSGDRFLVRLKDRDLEYPISQVSISPALGSMQRSLRLPDGGLCEFDDLAMASEIESAKGGHRVSGVIHRWEKNLGYAFLALLLCVASVASFINWGLPVMAKRVAYSFPQNFEQRLGKDSLEMLDKLLFKPTRLTAERQAEARSIFGSVVSSFPDYTNYRLELRDGGKLGANAFALPGGTVIITDALVDISRGEADLGAVIAHEISHIKNRHAIRHILQSSSTAVILAALTGDITSATSLAATLPTVLAEARYSRDFEREADEGALLWLLSRNLPKKPYAELLGRLDAQLNAKNGGVANSGGVHNYLSTHPDTGERIRRILK